MSSALLPTHPALPHLDPQWPQTLCRAWTQQTGVKRLSTSWSDVPGIASVLDNLHTHAFHSYPRPVNVWHGDAEVGEAL